MRLTAVLAVVACASLGFAQSNDPKVLKAMEKEYTAAKAAFAKTPKVKKVKDRFLTAGVKYGHESMVSPILAPKVKYRQALHIYGEVLKVDPNNPVARPEYDLIVRIYKSMGRPIPK